MSMEIENPHFCASWDFMYIEPEDPEWEFCTCDRTITTWEQVVGLVRDSGAVDEEK